MNDTNVCTVVLLALVPPLQVELLLLMRKLCLLNVVTLFINTIIVRMTTLVLLVFALAVLLQQSLLSLSLCRSYSG